MRILAIGNSYTEDALRYLHDIAAADGVEIETLALFIGGCSLEKHVRNVREDAVAYDEIRNGKRTGVRLSIDEALREGNWDLVTLQQQSSSAADYATYQPWLDELAAHVRAGAPGAKLLLHQTWAYRDIPAELARFGFESAADMFARVEKAYAKAAEVIGAAGVIPSGRAFHALLTYGAPDFHRDLIHASLGLGRYTLGLTWYRYLTGADLEKNTFDATDEPVSAEERVLAVRAATEAADAAVPVK